MLMGWDLNPHKLHGLTDRSVQTICATHQYFGSGETRTLYYGLKVRCVPCYATNPYLDSDRFALPRITRPPSYSRVGYYSPKSPLCAMSSS